MSRLYSPKSGSVHGRGKDKALFVFGVRPFYAKAALCLLLLGMAMASRGGTDLNNQQVMEQEYGRVLDYLLRVAESVDVNADLVRFHQEATDGTGHFSESQDPLPNWMIDLERVPNPDDPTGRRHEMFSRYDEIGGNPQHSSVTPDDPSLTFLVRSGYSEIKRRYYYYYRALDRGRFGSILLSDTQQKEMQDSLLKAIQAGSYAASKFAHVGNVVEYPYAVVRAPRHDVDYPQQSPEYGPEHSFNDFVLQDGPGRFFDTSKIKNASGVDFFPVDYIERIEDINFITKFTINLSLSVLLDNEIEEGSTSDEYGNNRVALRNGEAAANLISWLSKLHQDETIGHRLLKASIAGPGYYHQTTEKVALFFTGGGRDFIDSVENLIVRDFRRLQINDRLEGSGPVLMYPLREGLSVSTFPVVDLNVPKNSVPYQWGRLINARWMDPMLLHLLDPTAMGMILKAFKNPGAGLWGRIGRAGCVF